MGAGWSATIDFSDIVNKEMGDEERDRKQQLTRSYVELLFNSAGPDKAGLARFHLIHDGRSR